MQAIVSAPHQPNHIEFREVAEPVPARDEVIITARAVSLNRGNFRRLAWENDGWIPGYDVAGEISQTAADGSGPPLGTRVVGIVPSGAWAQQVAVPTRRLAAIPNHVSFEAAAAIPVSGLTSLLSLAHGGMLLGKHVLITGAAGGVGRIAIQLAHLQGAHITAQIGRPERAKGLRELGAASIILDIDKSKQAFDLVLESIGGNILAQSLTHLAPGGTVVSIGASSDEKTNFDVLGLVRKGAIKLYALSLFQEMELQGMGTRQLAMLLDLLASHRLDPQIDQQRSWRHMGEMLAALGDRRIDGKAIAIVD